MMSGTTFRAILSQSADPPIFASDSRIVETDLYTHVKEAFVNPCQTGELPRILIIGDSISIGYTEPVRQNLKELAEVCRPPVNCQHTGYGLANIHSWLGNGKWDVIHFNFGIWDTHLLDSAGNIMLDSDNELLLSEIRIRHTPEQYRDNLARLIGILKGTGAKLIWASSTPIMSRSGKRFEAIPILNGIAAELMKSKGIAINDLYGFVLPHVKIWQNADQVHFNPTGNEHLGRQVSRIIRNTSQDGR